MKPLRTLYVCYFGLREPLVQTQVLPYLRQLTSENVQVSLLTFEPGLHENWTREEISHQRSRLRSEGISWHCLKYHKWPSLPATLYDIAVGSWRILRIMKREGVNVLHARNHVPALMCMIAKKIRRAQFIFDIRGLMAEEYTDAGVWTENSLKFRAIKMLERAAIKKADQVVVLTQAMKKWVREVCAATPEKIEVIPCCVDFERYSENRGGTQIEPDGFEVVYAGAVTGLYLLDEMVAFFVALRAQLPIAFLRILTRSPPGETSARLRRAGLTVEDFWVGGVDPNEVPDYLQRARLGLSFRKNTFSQVAASPTKIPEYLAAGVPVVSNAGIGDVDHLLESENVGVILRDFSANEFTRVAKQAIVLASEIDVRKRCIEVARRHFDVRTVGANGYANVYRRLASPDAQRGLGQCVPEETSRGS